MDTPLGADALQGLTREHAALRRVATFVARQPPPAEVFALVTREAGTLLGARITGLLRVESPETAVFVAGWSQDEASLPIGVRGPLDGRGLMGRIVRTRRPVRLEDYDEVTGKATKAAIAKLPTGCNGRSHAPDSALSTMVAWIFIPAVSRRE